MIVASIKTKIVALATVATFLSSSAQAGGLAGAIWVGTGSTDPITDPPYSIAMAGDPAGVDGFMALRCKNGDVDIFIEPPSKESPLTVGSRRGMTIRFDRAEPIIVDAVATEPRRLAIDHHRDEKLLLPFMTAKTVTVGFSGVYSQSYTMQFIFAWHPANALSKVGRVLADCGVTPRGQWEADLAKSSGQSTSAKKKSREK
jgi:hypothetical protein